VILFPAAFRIEGETNLANSFHDADQVLVMVYSELRPLRPATAEAQK
jgi:hypothetical protein